MTEPKCDHEWGDTELHVCQLEAGHAGCCECDCGEFDDPNYLEYAMAFIREES